MVNLKKILLLTLFLISILVLSIRLSSLPIKLLNPQQKAGIKVFSMPDEAEILINGVTVGKTPYEDSNLDGKEVKIKLSVSEANWEGMVSLNEGTITIVNRELSTEVASSSGEILTLNQGKGVTMVSSPQDALIEIDGKNVGRTPTHVDVSSGEHMFVFSKNGFSKRSIKATVPEGFNLGIKVDLAISGLDLTQLSIPPVTVTPKLKVLSTPTGFLRIRDRASINGKEIARVSPGDELINLEELNNWFKVRLTNGQEGFVSSQYVRKE